MNYFKLMIRLIGSRRNQSKSKKFINEQQQKRLRKLLLHTYEHSEYYNRIFKKEGITKESLKVYGIESVPTINKECFMANYDEIVTDSNLKQEQLRNFDLLDKVDNKIFNEKYHVIHSSGSTGKPCYFAYDQKAWESMLIGILRAAFWDMKWIEIFKLLLSKPKVVYIAATDGRYAGAMAVGDGIDGLSVEQTYIDINMPIELWVDQIVKFKPNVIIGYPSAIKILGELIEQNKVHLDVKKIISCGEYLSPNLRGYIELTFKAKITNVYGASESLAMGVECHNDAGMTLFDDLNLIEMIEGKMYLTCLYNYSQPIIRYELSDQIKIEKYPIMRQSAFTLAKEFYGRNEDIIWFKNQEGVNEFLHPLSIEGFCIEGLLDYQFFSLNDNSLIMLAEVSCERMSSAVRKSMLLEMRKILTEKKLDYVSFNIYFVDKIMPNKKTGKKQLIISKEEGEEKLNERRATMVQSAI